MLDAEFDNAVITGFAGLLTAHAGTASNGAQIIDNPRIIVIANIRKRQTAGT